MSKSSAAIAQEYYKAVAENDAATVEKLFHPDIHFIGPIAEKRGKESVFEATKHFMSFIKGLKVRKVIGSDNQAMVVYDGEFSAPIGKVRTAVLLTTQNGLIAEIELFFDSLPFEKLKSQTPSK